MLSNRSLKSSHFKYLWHQLCIFIDSTYERICAAAHIRSVAIQTRPTKGKFWDKFFEQSNQGLDSLKCLSQNVGLKTVVLSLITVLSLAARTTSLIMHANGTAEPLASPPPQDKTNGPEI